MSDIDFDELDKAVNSLMQPSGDDNLPAQDKSKTTPDKAVIDNHGVGMDDSPTDDIEAQTPKSDPRPPAPASLAVKRRGQFMDMIHPSADMKTKTAPAGSLSRKGLAVQPRNDFEANEPISGNFTQTAANTVGAEVSMTAAGTTYVDAEPDTTFTSDVTDAEESPMTDWPDPLDVEDQSETEEPLSELSDLSDSSDVNDTLDGLIDEDDQAGYEVSDTTQPSYPDPIDSMSSPFLPDAKVEKRPLGPVKTKDADQESSENVIDEESTDTEVSEVHGDSEPAPIDIPEELHASLMSLEGLSLIHI